MPAGLIDNPQYWRARAKEARVVAQSMQDAKSREIMLGIARDYERMAAKSEERLKRNIKEEDISSRSAH